MPQPEQDKKMLRLQPKRVTNKPFLALILLKIDLETCARPLWARTGLQYLKKIILGDKITWYRSNFAHSISFLEGDKITSILGNFVTQTKLKKSGPRC